MKSILTLAIVFLFTFGCKVNSPTNSLSSNNQDNGKIYEEEKGNTTGVIIELPQIVKLSPNEITKQLGDPKREWSVGSVGTARTYNVNQGEAELTIIYKDNKISEFELKLSKLRDSAEDTLRSGGFEIKDKPNWENSITKIYKNRSFNGINFREIRVSMSPPEQKWESLTLEAAGR